MSNHYIDKYIAKAAARMPQNYWGQFLRIWAKRLAMQPSFLLPWIARKRLLELSGGAVSVVGDGPVITADNNPYVDPVEITMTGEAGATIYWTNDGNDPTELSAEYSAPFNLTGADSWTVKAIQKFSGGSLSAVTTLVVTRTATAAPTMDPDGGDHTTSVDVELASATPAAVITYSLNLSTPTISPVNQYLYAGAFTLTAPTTVKAIAKATGYSASSVITRDFDVVGANIYYGASSSETLSAAEILALSSKALADPGGSYVFGANTPDKYLYMIWKASLAYQPASSDGFVTGGMQMVGDLADTAPYTNLDNGWNYAIVSVGGENYRVYRTKYAQGLAMTIEVTTAAIS